MHLACCGVVQISEVFWGLILLFCFPLTLINGAFSLFLTERLILLKLYMEFISNLGGRSVPLERAFIYVRYQGAPPHLGHFKLNLWQAVLSANRINLDCEPMRASLWSCILRRAYLFIFLQLQGQI